MINANETSNNTFDPDIPSGLRKPILEKIKGFFKDNWVILAALITAITFFGNNFNCIEHRFKGVDSEIKGLNYKIDSIKANLTAQSKEFDLKLKEYSFEVDKKFYEFSKTKQK
ncbi:MAG: hypothetical protein A2287_07740 [Candidatus Melainabacteria bacterium RIFOXYA12_FULL_32_12]|nr:MAG: hypothetical protein A2255_00460 [Candidatus Melainabacteria bacterium RIFOXYA2_FULL_32_9]OGI25802.1 MAG: hypothetical protein A2287_07740 [Candidatus Melainabacteria bacterium RIFOXYA12_FULL_32_12]